MTDDDDSVGYAVVGLGWIAQVAVLPAFANARRNSRLAALVSGNEGKREMLGRRYGVDPYHYDAYDEVLARDDVDAVYIALPNHLHRDYAVRAAEAGVHVLCEKPMAVTADECRAMIDAAAEAGVRLMVAYRLHFDEANLSAAEAVRSGAIGEPRIFSSVFTQQVAAGDVRLAPVEKGGGTFYDIGIYCINAARHLFGAEPERALATATWSGEERFEHVPATTSAVLQFPGERLAQFTCSFGVAAASTFRVVGTEGELALENAYSYRGPRRRRASGPAGEEERVFPDADQFGPELLYFSDCIRDGRDPGPSGEEGLADIRIIEALHGSMREERPLELEPTEIDRRPTVRQAITCPPVEQPELVEESNPVA